MASANERKELLKQLLCGKTVRLLLDDERQIQGKLECFDKGKNIMLADTVQLHKDATLSQLGSVMIPGSHIRRVELLDTVS
jgi:small nuclear ribonucleoprotein (snRNP)-like protein